MSLCLLIFDLSADTLFGIPTRWLYAIPIIAVMNMTNICDLTVLRNQYRSITFGIFEIVKTTINLTVTIILIVIFKYTWDGGVWGILSASVVFGIVGVFHMKTIGFFRFSINASVVKKVLKISLPLIPHTLGAIVISTSDRLFIERMVGIEEAGIYTVGYSFGLIVSLIVDSFNKSWSPWMYKQLASINDQKKAQIVRYTYLYYVAVLILALGVTAISMFLIELMTTEQYYGGQRYVFWIALGYASNGMYTMVTIYLINEAKTGFLAFITFISAIINLVGNYFLIKYNGALGAAQSTVIAFTFRFIAVWWFSNKIYPMPWFSTNLIKKWKNIN